MGSTNATTGEQAWWRHEVNDACIHGDAATIIVGWQQAGAPERGVDIARELELI